MTMSGQKSETGNAPQQDTTLIERYRPLGLKAVRAAALHQKPKSGAKAAKDSARPQKPHAERD